MSPTDCISQAGNRKRGLAGVRDARFCFGGSAAGVSAKRALQIALHRVELRSPVLPTVGAVGWEVEHGVVPARGVVGVLELLVAADHEVAFEERGRQVGAAKFV